MRILTIVGTRPQLIKAAALQPALRALHEETFVDTGQHYDTQMAGDFFDELGLAAPDYRLGIGSGGHSTQTGRMLVALDEIVARERPDAILVYGDTNSTMAGALAGAKAGVHVAHVEAGLRSYNRRMPEEVNRVVVDHVSTWLFAPNRTAVANLAAEGLVRGVLQVGDVLQDLCARVAPEVASPAVLDAIEEKLALPKSRRSLEPGGYLFATIHRAENREEQRTRDWVSLLRAVAGPERPVVMPLHPGTRRSLGGLDRELGPNVHVVEPVGYKTSLALQLHAAAVLTDSGGVQREAAWLGTPCLVLRSTTEWVEAVVGRTSGATVALVGVDPLAAERALAELAPPGDARQRAARRVADLALRSPGAAAAIAEALSVPARTWSDWR